MHLSSTKRHFSLHVNCFSANLSSLPLRLPPLPKSYVRYKLEFTNNKKLRRLEYRPYFDSTPILDANNCGFTEIGMELWTSILRKKWVNVRGVTGMEQGLDNS